MAINYSNVANYFAVEPFPARAVLSLGAITTGETILVWITSQRLVTSVVDSASNTYILDAVVSWYSGLNQYAFRAFNVTGSAAMSLTITFGAPGRMFISVFRVQTVLTFVGTVNAFGELSAWTPNSTGGWKDTEIIGPGSMVPPATQSLTLAGVGQIPSMSAFRGEYNQRPSGWSDFDSYWYSSFPRQPPSLVGLLQTTQVQIKPLWTFHVTTGSNNLYHPSVIWVSMMAMYIEAIIADFTGTPTSGAVPLLVQFTDASRGNPTAWFWQFGDGQLSLEQNPLVNFPIAGTYSITLDASRPFSSARRFRQDYIVAGAGGPTPGGPPTPPGIPTDFSDPAEWMPIFDILFGEGMGEGMGEFDGELGLGDAMFDFFGDEFGPDMPLSPEEAAEQDEVQQQLEALPFAPPQPGDEASMGAAMRALANVWNAFSRSVNIGVTDGPEFRMVTGGFSESDAPGVNDDASRGAEPGTFWIENQPPDDNGNEQPPFIWMCISADVGEALWVRVETYGPGNDQTGVR